MSDQLKISRLKPTGGGYKAWISGEKEPLVLTAELVHRNRLKEGIILTPPQLDQLRHEAEEILIDNTVARLLSGRDHTERELRTKLVRKKFSREAIDKSIRKHRSLGYIDDARTAETLAGRAYRKKPCGRSYLLALLARKGVERGLAERTVDRLLEDEDDSLAAVAALRQKWPVPDELEVESVRTKAYSYLSRRGFGYRAARAAFSEYFGTSEKADDD